MNNIKTLEDCVAFLVDKKHADTVRLRKPDYTLFYSMARQIKSGVGFTEKQKKLIEHKIRQYYMGYFCGNEHCLLTTRIPVRVVNHVNQITVVDIDKENVNIPPRFSSVFQGKVVRVEFSFNKKFLNKIKNIESTIGIGEYCHPHGSKIHYFLFKSNVIYDLVSEFENTKMIIDDELVQIKNKVDDIYANADKYCSTIDESGSLTISEYDAKHVPNPSVSSLHIIDRHRRYGMNINNSYIPSTLTEQIAYRKTRYLHANRDEVGITDIVQSIIELDRFPLLVVLNKNTALADLTNIHGAISAYVSNAEQSVLFRMDKGHAFNSYVHENSLNSFVDKTTKVVYIEQKNIPKVLLKADWKPISCIQSTSFVRKSIELYTDTHCDLCIYYEKELSSFRKYKIKYDKLQINNTG